MYAHSVHSTTDAAVARPCPHPATGPRRRPLSPDAAFLSPLRALPPCTDLLGRRAAGGGPRRRPLGCRGPVVPVLCAGRPCLPPRRAATRRRAFLGVSSSGAARAPGRRRSSLAAAGSLLPSGHSRPAYVGRLASHAAGWSRRPGLRPLPPAVLRGRGGPAPRRVPPRHDGPARCRPRRAARSRCLSRALRALRPCSRRAAPPPATGDLSSQRALVFARQVITALISVSRFLAAGGPPRRQSSLPAPPF